MRRSTARSSPAERLNPPREGVERDAFAVVEDELDRVACIIDDLCCLRDSTRGYNFAASRSSSSSSCARRSCADCSSRHARPASKWCPACTRSPIPTALIRVGDDGCGIPADELPRIFERLYRGAEERAATPEGSGLGPAIASSLVAAMDGTIEVRSAPAEGTTFSIQVPLARMRDAPTDGGSIARVAVKTAAIAAAFRPD